MRDCQAMAHGQPLTRDPSPIRQASLREHNLALVLRQVATAGTRSGPALTGRHPTSRADIATATGLTRATVSALVDDLITGRLVAEVAPAPKSGAGRPSVGLSLDPRGPAGLGLEINVDYLAACVVDLTGAIRHREILHADQRPRTPAEVLDALTGLAANVDRGDHRAGADAGRRGARRTGPGPGPHRPARTQPGLAERRHARRKSPASTYASTTRPTSPRSAKC